MKIHFYGFIVWAVNIYLSPITCPVRIPPVMKIEVPIPMAPRKAVGAISPKYRGWTLIAMPAKINNSHCNTAELWPAGSHLEQNLLSRNIWTLKGFCNFNYFNYITFAILHIDFAVVVLAESEQRHDWGTFRIHPNAFFRNTRDSTPLAVMIAHSVCFFASLLFHQGF